MTVSLSPEVQEFINAKVRAGQFASPDEAVNTMLARLRENEGPATGTTAASGSSFPVFAVPAGTPTFSGDDVRRAEEDA